MDRVARALRLGSLQPRLLLFAIPNVQRVDFIRLRTFWLALEMLLFPP